MLPFAQKAAKVMSSVYGCCVYEREGGGTGGEEEAALKERVWTTEIPPSAN